MQKMSNVSNYFYLNLKIISEHRGLEVNEGGKQRGQLTNKFFFQYFFWGQIFHFFILYNIYMQQYLPITFHLFLINNLYGCVCKKIERLILRTEV